MGCGAICGDNILIQPSDNILYAQQTTQKLIQRLDKATILASKKTFQHFINLYNQHPKRFHLSPNSHLTSQDEIPSDVLLKWKLVLYGLDSEQKKYSSCLGLVQISDLQPQPELNGPILPSHLPQTIIFHECFTQIEKDLDRTIALPAGRKRDFQNILKRIANFFPKMGYTQGLNFIIGYLIIIGYSEQDSFWIFVHLALNRRYLLLGLYEDGFPLSNTLIIVFKNILKRKRPQLYEHMFQTLCMDPSTWIFKWFTTCYIYSFPLQLVKYIWDIMIQVGSLGVVTFAVSLTLELQPFLMEQEDLADASQFIQSLKTLEVMNHYVNVEKVVNGAFQLQVTYADFEGTQEFGGFYATYLKQKYKELQTFQLQKNQALPTYSQLNPKSQQLLDQWYQKLNEERQTFIKSNKSPNTLALQILVESNQKLIKRSESGQIQLLLSQPSQKRLTSQESKIRKLSCDLNKTQLEIQGMRIQLFDKISKKLNEQSDSQKSKHSKKGREVGSGKHSGLHKREVIRDILKKKGGTVLDQLDKLERQFDIKSQKSATLNNYAPQPVAKSSQTTFLSVLGSSLAVKMTAKHKFKIENCDGSSLRSRNVSSSSKMKGSIASIADQTSKISKICASKTKTQEKKIAHCERSQLASLKDQLSDRDSASNQNLSQNGQSSDGLKSVCGQKVQNHRERVSTTVDYMINSHGPTLKQKQVGLFAGQAKLRIGQGQQQVVVLPFKKIKRQKQGRIGHIEISKRQPPSDLLDLNYEHGEESLESIRPYSVQRSIDPTSSHKQTDCPAICEIESVR